MSGAGHAEVQGGRIDRGMRDGSGGGPGGPGGGGANPMADRSGLSSAAQGRLGLDRSTANPMGDRSGLTAGAIGRLGLGGFLDKFGARSTNGIQGAIEKGVPVAPGLVEQTLWDKVWSMAPFVTRFTTVDPLTGAPAKHWGGNVGGILGDIAGAVAPGIGSFAGLAEGLGPTYDFATGTWRSSLNNAGKPGKTGTVADLDLDSPARSSGQNVGGANAGGKSRIDTRLGDMFA